MTSGVKIVDPRFSRSELVQQLLDCEDPDKAILGMSDDCNAPYRVLRAISAFAEGQVDVFEVTHADSEPISALTAFINQPEGRAVVANWYAFCGTEIPRHLRDAEAIFDNPFRAGFFHIFYTKELIDNSLKSLTKSLIEAQQH